jgi:hypothetical protein
MVRQPTLACIVAIRDPEVGMHTRHRRQRHMALLGGIEVGLAAALTCVRPVLFERFFVGLPPLVVVGFAAGVGVWLVGALSNRGFPVEPDANGGRVVAGVLATAAGFGAMAVSADLLLGFPADLNVPLPEAWLYYPVMGFVADVLLHLVPLGLALTGARLATGREPAGAWLWSCATLAAIPETVLQVAAGRAEGSSPAIEVFVAIHLLGFGLAQLWWLRRGGFFAMHGMRLAYYGIWHLAWGYLRLA